MARQAEAQLFFLNLDNEYDKRYDLGKFMNYDEDGFDPLNSYMLEKISGIKSGGQFTVTSEEGRPDIISNKIYGDTQYWWVILLYNAITSFDDLVNGMELKYPKLQELEDFYFSLKSQQTQLNRNG